MSTTSSSLQERDSEIDYVHEKRSAGSQSQQCNQTESVDEKTNSTGPAGKSDNLDNGKPKNVTDISIDPMDMLDDIVDLPEYAQGHKMILTFPQKLMLALTYVERECAKSGRTPEQAALAWISDGKAFVIRKKATFYGEWMKLFFGEAKLSSFTRKLYRWGYRKISVQGEGATPASSLFFWNENFRRDDKKLLSKMQSVTAAKTRSHEAKTESSDPLKMQQGQVLNTSSSAFAFPTLSVQNSTGDAANGNSISSVDPMVILQARSLALQQASHLSIPQSTALQSYPVVVQGNSIPQSIQTNSSPEVQILQTLLALYAQPAGSQPVLQQLVTAWMTALVQLQQQTSAPPNQTLQFTPEVFASPAAVAPFAVSPFYQMPLQQPPSAQYPQLIPTASNVATNSPIEPAVALLLGQLLLAQQQQQQQQQPQAVPSFAPQAQQQAVQHRQTVANASSQEAVTSALINLQQFLPQISTAQGTEPVPVTSISQNMVQYLYPSGTEQNQNQQQSDNAAPPSPDL